VRLFSLGSSNKNDEAAFVLRQAVLMKLPPGIEVDLELDFEARENLGMVVNRLFQPLHAYMTFTNQPFLVALEQAIKKSIPQHVLARVLDVGGGATGGIAAMMAAKAGMSLFFVRSSIYTSARHSSIHPSSIHKRTRKQIQAQSAS